MPIGTFATLLSELGEKLKLPLKPDEHDACLIRLPQDLALQMELDPEQTFFYLDAILGEVPEGPYRERLFEQAMRFNGRIPPRDELLAYSDLKNCLVLFQRLPVKGLTGQKIFDRLPAFCKQALIWKEALARGELPEIEVEEEGSGPSPLSNIFGLSR